MKILYVTAYDPSIETNGGGGYVDRRFVEELRDAGHSVSVVQVTDLSPNGPIELHIRNSFTKKARCLARMIIRSEPYAAAKFRMSSNWNSACDRLVQLAQNCDIVVASQWAGLLMCYDADVRIDTYIAHNMEYYLSRMYAPAIMRLLGDACRHKKLEMDAFSTARSIGALSRLDVKRVGATGSVRALVIPRRAVAPFPAIANGGSDVFSIGFIGQMDWPPNVEAVKFIVENVLPEIDIDLRSEGRRVRLVLAGRGSDDVRLYANSDCEILPLGKVSDVATFYGQIDATVVIRGEESTGVSIKLHEAIERSIPVVASRSLLDALPIEGHGAEVYGANSLKEIRTALRSIVSRSCKVQSNAGGSEGVTAVTSAAWTEVPPLGEDGSDSWSITDFVEALSSRKVEL